jgi:putative oxidoreductase
MPDSTLPALALAGRVLLSAIFLMAGAAKLANYTGTAEMMTKHGMPAVPFFLVAAALVELVGGLAVLVGYKARFGALALALFLIPTTLIFHNFWGVSGKEAEEQMQHFMKNVAIMGGLLMVAAQGPGEWSLDARKKPNIPVV